MNSMFDSQAILKLLKSFYIITKIKVVILDAEFNEIMAFPETKRA